jgi:Holliday junction resolvasome RuvABC endonuclease subunit
MKTIGIDLSYGKPTWVSVLSQHGKLIHSFSVEPRPNLFEHAQDIANLCLGLATGEEVLVAMETPYVHRNIAVALNLARLVGMLRALLEPHGATVIEVQASQWQNALLKPKKGSNRKELSRKRVRKVCGFLPKTSDEADSINIALFARKLDE